MTEKQLKEIIKAKEAELKALKDQLKEMQSQIKEEAKIENVTYTVESLNKYNVSDLVKISKQNNIRVISKNKKILIDNMVSIMHGRINKGIAFK